MTVNILLHSQDTQPEKRESEEEKGEVADKLNTELTEVIERHTQLHEWVESFDFTYIDRYFMVARLKQLK